MSWEFGDAQTYFRPADSTGYRVIVGTNVMGAVDR